MKNKKIIIAGGTGFIGQAVREAIVPPKLWINAAVPFGTYFRLRRNKQSQTLQISPVCLLPFAIIPFEKPLSELPGKYEAYTFRDINATPEKIWSNVVRVREIAEKEDHGS